MVYPRWVPALYGPHTLSSQAQVKIPADLVRDMRLQGGDRFHWRRSDDDPAVLLLIPAEVVERRYEAGRARELASREPAVELDHPTESPTTSREGTER